MIVTRAYSIHKLLFVISDSLFVKRLSRIKIIFRTMKNINCHRYNNQLFPLLIFASISLSFCNDLSSNFNASVQLPPVIEQHLNNTSLHNNYSDINLINTNINITKNHKPFVRFPGSHESAVHNNINSTSVLNKQINDYTNQTSDTYEGLKGHIPSFNSGAVKRAFYVVFGLTVLSVTYLLFRNSRLRQSPAQMVRKYGVLANKQDIEMRPLPLDEDDDDDTVVFDASGFLKNTRITQKNF